MLGFRKPTLSGIWTDKAEGVLPHLGLPVFAAHLRLASFLVRNSGGSLNPERQQMFRAPLGEEDYVWIGFKEPCTTEKCLAWGIQIILKYPMAISKA